MSDFSDWTPDLDVDDDVTFTEPDHPLTGLYGKVLHTQSFTLTVEIAGGTGTWRRTSFTKGHVSLAPSKSESPTCGAV